MLFRRVLPMLALALWIGTAGCGTTEDTGGPTGPSEEELVAEYNTVADCLLKCRQRENEIMAALLGIYGKQAAQALETAKSAQGDAREGPMRDAIEAVMKIAQEGDKDVDAIKLRLRKGGHHHNTAEGSTEEYILVDPESKAKLMADAAKLRQMLATAPAPTWVADIEAVGERVAEILKKVAAPKS